MATRAPPRRIAVHVHGGYAPPLHAVVAGAVLAATELGWPVLAIRDGFDGILFPERYPAGALVKLTRAIAGDPASEIGLFCGTAAADPFRVQVATALHVEEQDRSDALLEALRAAHIGAVVSIVDRAGLALAHRLHRKGLDIVCVPKSIEHDVASASPSLGFDTALSEVTTLLEAARRAARSASSIVVAEVLGDHAGWLALHAALGVRADAVLIPEIPYDVRRLAERLRAPHDGRAASLVVVAEGAVAANGATRHRDADPVRGFLSPLATGEEGSTAIFRAGGVAESVARELRRLTAREAVPVSVGQLARGGSPTATDRQLGIAYGAAAVRALERGGSGAVVSLHGPGLELVPLAAAVHAVRSVPAKGVFVETARAVGISLGD